MASPSTHERDIANDADIELLRRLVEIESLSAQEQDAVAFLREEMAKRRFTVLDDAAGSAVGTIGSGDLHIVLLGHIDTVPGRIPVRIENGVLHGRGSVDAKGPLATFVAAASAAAPQLKARVTVAAAVGEEAIGSIGANEIAKWDAPDFCVIGEPSGWDTLCLGYRGSVSVLVTFRSDMRHSAGPGETIAEEAIAFWNALRAHVDQINAEATNSFNSVGHALRVFNTKSDGLTDEARLSIGLRLPPDLDVDALLAKVHALAGDAEVTIEGIQYGYRTGKGSKLTPPFLRAIRAEGGNPRFTVKLGTSDMNVVGPVWKCPIAAYGPGDSSLDHTPEERIDLVEYGRSIRILTNVLLAFGAESANASTGASGNG
jgi:LysW-gamma-L-lysine carboxypeptidase